MAQTSFSGSSATVAALAGIQILLLPTSAANRAAFAKFPVSMQAINSLLSSTVFLRTKAGFPFPHFGRLRMVLVLPGTLLQEEMDDSEAERLRESTGLVALM